MASPSGYVTVLVRDALHFSQFCCGSGVKSFGQKVSCSSARWAYARRADADGIAHSLYASSCQKGYGPNVFSHSLAINGLTHLAAARTTAVGNGRLGVRSSAVAGGAAPDSSPFAQPRFCDLVSSAGAVPCERLPTMDELLTTMPGMADVAGAGLPVIDFVRVRRTS